MPFESDRQEPLGPLIAVASRSFSSSSELRGLLEEQFPRCRFNTEGARLSGDALIDFLAGARGIIVGVEPIDADVLKALPELRVISKYGVGLDTIDLDAVEHSGVTLATARGTNSAAVAELALMLMLGVLRRVPEALAGVQQHRWSGISGRLLQGKTVGLIGVGHVARELLPLLQAFSCTVLGYDEAPVSMPGIQMVPLEFLLAESDVVSLHLPLLPTTEHFMNRERLATMKPTAILVNTSRGGVVDEDALADALRTSTLAGAGLDVLAQEPPEDWSLAMMPTVLVTPHIAGSSQESNRVMGLAAIDGLVRHHALLD